MNSLKILFKRIVAKIQKATLPSTINFTKQADSSATWIQIRIFASPDRSQCFDFFVFIRWLMCHRLYDDRRL